MEKGEYLEAIKLCKEGEEKDKHFRGLVSDWKQHRLQAYEALGDLQCQKELMFDFLYGDEYDYYSKLKELYPPHEWCVVLEKILETFEKQSYLPSTYVEIIKNENMNYKLLEYCKHCLSALISL
jgi:hypothetical protein